MTQVKQQNLRHQRAAHVAVQRSLVFAFKADPLQKFGNGRIGHVGATRSTQQRRAQLRVPHVEFDVQRLYDGGRGGAVHHLGLDQQQQAGAQRKGVVFELEGALAAEHVEHLEEAVAMRLQHPTRLIVIAGGPQHIDGGTQHDAYSTLRARP